MGLACNLHKIHRKQICDPSDSHSMTHMWTIYNYEPPVTHTVTHMWPIRDPSQICKFKGENWLRAPIIHIHNVTYLWQVNRWINLEKLTKVVSIRKCNPYTTYLRLIYDSSQIGKLKGKIWLGTLIFHIRSAAQLWRCHRWVWRGCIRKFNLSATHVRQLFHNVQQQFGNKLVAGDKTRLGSSDWWKITLIIFHIINVARL